MMSFNQAISKLRKMYNEYRAAERKKHQERLANLKTQADKMEEEARYRERISAAEIKIIKAEQAVKEAKKKAESKGGGFDFGGIIRGIESFFGGNNSGKRGRKKSRSGGGFNIDDWF